MESLCVPRLLMSAFRHLFEIVIPSRVNAILPEAVAAHVDLFYYFHAMLADPHGAARLRVIWVGHGNLPRLPSASPLQGGVTLGALDQTGRDSQNALAFGVPKSKYQTPCPGLRPPDALPPSTPQLDF